MTNEERDIISQFIGRVGGSQVTQGGGFASSVPATQPALPPVDREADAFIAEQFQRYPEARYRITQLAFVQEHALVEAQNRIKRLEWELQQAQQQAQQAAQQAQQQGGQRSGFFSGLFGGGNRPQGPYQSGGYQNQPGWNQGYAQQPPPPQYPPGYQPGIFQRGGSGFLGSALTTAAGVAGGMVVGNALMDLFSGHHGYGGFGGMPGYAPGASPWVAPADPGYADQSPWTTPPDNAGAGAPDQDYVDTGSWDTSGDAAGGVDPSQPDDNSGGWDFGGGDSGSDDDTF